MLPLSANPDFKNLDNASFDNPYFDLALDDMDNINVIYGPDAINQAIENVLTTEPFERLFNLDFFSPLYFLFFEQSDKAEDYVSKCLDKIEMWIPIIIDRSNVNVTLSEDQHEVSFRIPWATTDGLYAGIFNRIIEK